MSGLEKVREELEGLGYAPEIVHFAGLSIDGGRVVTFSYAVDVGRYRGGEYEVGVSFQETAYPEYPPHFLHILEPPSIACAPAHFTHVHDGKWWHAFSVPPSDFWDQIPPEQKNMRTYLDRHLRRFWDQA